MPTSVTVDGIFELFPITAELTGNVVPKVVGSTVFESIPANPGFTSGIPNVFYQGIFNSDVSYVAPPPPVDTYFANVSLLLHMNGANDSTTFTDSSSNSLTVTPSGSAKISTAQSKFEGASAYFDKLGYLSVSSNDKLDLPGDFTLEAWFYQPSGFYQTFPILFEKGVADSASNYGVIVSNTTNPYTMSFFYGNPRSYISMGSYSYNSWHNIAVTRSNGTIRTFNNGTLIATENVANNFTSGNSYPLVIGSAATTTSNRLDGYVDELRITKGQARYTASFTVSNTPFLNVGPTVEIQSSMNPEWRRPNRVI